MNTQDGPKVTNGESLETDSSVDTIPGSGRSIRFLVVDDDPSFGKIFKKIAKESNISVILCESLSEPKILAGQRFDAAIVDYDLGTSESGVVLAEKLKQVLGNIPIILISQTDRKPEARFKWPHFIRGFMNKNVGHQVLFDAILVEYQHWRIKRGFSPK